MAYLDYGEYLSIGGVCDFTVFQRNIDHACAIIDSYTYGRIAKMEAITLRVKNLCRDLVEYLATNLSVNQKNITSKSQSAGNISESVSYENKASADVEKETKSLVFEYLWCEVDDNGMPVLYKGASV